MTAAFEFLVVDEFLASLLHLRVLKTAFELDLIDRLAGRPAGDAAALGRMVGLEPASAEFLFNMLTVCGIVEQNGGDLRLTRKFRTALRYRDLLEIKLEYAGFCIGDFTNGFTLLLRDRARFAQGAALFKLFDYAKGFEPSFENYAHTRRWVKVTSTLTRYEAEALLSVFDPAPFRHALDVGGNSGALMLALCRDNPQLSGVIYDLPVICEIGLEHVLAHAEHRRIAFKPGDLRHAPLPEGHDFISFKSFLHDWPEQETIQFLFKASTALQPGGTLLIFERSWLGQNPALAGVAMVPNLLFAPFYRRAEFYLDALRALGMLDVSCRDLALDSPFMVVTARKPAA